VSGIALNKYRSE